MRDVAPFTGAWIEIRRCVVGLCSPTSLPSRERGLKSTWSVEPSAKGRSLPSRERGLKYIPGGIMAIIDKGRSLHGSVD